MRGMAKKKPKPEKAEEKPRYPSRENYRSMYLPKAVYEAVEKVARSQERSVSFMAKKLILKALADMGVEVQQEDKDQ